jgi:hypothetical protein
MQNKELIISLIQQDLKHHQLVVGLDNIGLEAFDKHLLELFDVIYKLMEVPESAESEWGKTYTKYMNFAVNYELESTSESLEPLAGGCFQHLQAIIDIENEKIDKN